MKGHTFFIEIATIDDSQMDKIPLSETEKQVYKEIASQQVKGRKRYHKPMSYRQHKDPVKWVNEAIEEAADMLQYLVSLKVCLQKGKGVR